MTRESRRCVVVSACADFIEILSYSTTLNAWLLYTYESVNRASVVRVADPAFYWNGVAYTADPIITTGPLDRERLEERLGTMHSVP
jgi:hypothetical protein